MVSVSHRKNVPKIMAKVRETVLPVSEFAVSTSKYHFAFFSVKFSLDNVSLIFILIRILPYQFHIFLHF